MSARRWIVWPGDIPAETALPRTPYRIANAADLAQLGLTVADQDKCFVLVRDIDLAGEIWSAAVVPLFSGTFDGNDLTIRNLRITGGRDVGLFGEILDEGRVRNLHLCDVNIAADSSYSAGGLAGRNSGSIGNCHAAGCVDGLANVGGLVGYNYATVSNCTSSGSVGMAVEAGGVIGCNRGDVTACSSNAAVAGGDAGGVVGFHLDGNVVNCHGGGAITGNLSGGLVGRNAGNVVACFSDGKVLAAYYAGGLAGINAGGISDCFSTAEVTGDGSRQELTTDLNVGGLVAALWPGNKLINCYSAGPVRATGLAEGRHLQQGGLVGCDFTKGQSVVRNCFWDAQASGCAAALGGAIVKPSSPLATGLMTAQMQEISTYLNAGWDFAGETANGTKDIWKMPNGGGYPLLSWQEDAAGASAAAEGASGRRSRSSRISLRASIVGILRRSSG